MIVKTSIVTSVKNRNKFHLPSMIIGKEGNALTIYSTHFIFIWRLLIMTSEQNRTEPDIIYAR